MHIRRGTWYSITMYGTVLHCVILSCMRVLKGTRGLIFNAEKRFMVYLAKRLDVLLAGCTRVARSKKVETAKIGFNSQ